MKEQRGIPYTQSFPSIFIRIVCLTLGAWLSVGLMPVYRGTSSAATFEIDDLACKQAGPKGCLNLSLDAMGGRTHYESLKSARIEAIGYTRLPEQSYRQDPFITAYEQTKTTMDFAGGRLYRQRHTFWPEEDPGKDEFDTTLVANPAGAVNRSGGKDAPGSGADLDEVRYVFALGPARLLLTALNATDLHFESPVVIRTTPHQVVAFTWQRIPVKIMINPFNHFPDAVETTEYLRDFWYYAGDVKRTIYFDNWKLFSGYRYPTTTVEERNDLMWRSMQIRNFEPNVALDESQFQLDPKAAAASGRGGWEFPFSGANAVEIVPGLKFFPSAFNASIVKQDDGVVLLEVPASSMYTEGLIKEAARLYPDVPIKAALSTSDSWPHFGGVRQAVASGLPVYILDLNRTLAERFVKAPHKLHPDLLEQNPKSPKWQIVSGKMLVGAGPNRMEIYPLRGAVTERQYMVYFPEHQLLYVSDTIVINDDGTLYEPEFAQEIQDAIKREDLQVKTIFAMHQPPTPWDKVQDLLQKSKVH